MYFKSEITQFQLSDLFFYVDLRILFSGEGGIRTHGGASPTTVFETVPFNRSGTSPVSFASPIIPNPARSTGAKSQAYWELPWNCPPRQFLKTQTSSSFWFCANDPDQVGRLKGLGFIL